MIQNRIAKTEGIWPLSIQLSSARKKFNQLQWDACNHRWKKKVHLLEQQVVVKLPKPREETQWRFTNVTWKSKGQRKIPHPREWWWRSSKTSDRPIEREFRCTLVNETTWFRCCWSVVLMPMPKLFLCVCRDGSILFVRSVSWADPIQSKTLKCLPKFHYIL